MNAWAPMVSEFPAHRLSPSCPNISCMTTNWTVPLAFEKICSIWNVWYSACAADAATKSSAAIDAMIQNLATNFSGQSASVAAAGPAAPIIPIGGVYYDPTQSGSGFGFDYKDGTLIVEVYSYLQGGAAQWYLSAGPVVNNVYTGTLDKYTGGQCISCAFVAPTLVGNDGTITVTFTSPTTATVDLPGGRHFQIQRFFQ